MGYVGYGVGSGRASGYSLASPSVLSLAQEAMLTAFLSALRLLNSLGAFFCVLIFAATLWPAEHTR